MAIDQHGRLISGTQLQGGAFVIEGVLGQGGAGITYRASQVSPRRLVAIKEFFPQDFVTRHGVSVVPRPGMIIEDVTALRQMFRIEADTLASFNHPAIVQVYQVFEENHTVYMVLEFIDGRPLRAYCPMRDASDVMRWLDPICDALEMVHQRGFLHRDIAPDNILVRSDGRPVLLDFGAARMTAPDRTVLFSRHMISKQGYSAPEQYVGGAEHTPATDLYALAATLRCAVTGQPPVAADRRAFAMQNGEPDPMPPLADEAGPGYAPAFLAAVDRALAVRTVDRPQSVAAFRALLPNMDEDEEESRGGSGWRLPALVLLLVAAVLGAEVAGFGPSRFLGTSDDPVITDPDGDQRGQQIAANSDPTPTPAPPSVTPEPLPPSPTPEMPTPTPAEAQDPTPTPAEAQDPTPTPAEAQDPTPTPAEAQDPTPTLEAQGPTPTPAETQGPTPTPVETNPDKTRLAEKWPPVVPDEILRNPVVKPPIAEARALTIEGDPFLLGMLHGQEGRDQLHDIVLHPDGGYVAVGLTEREGLGAQGWVIRTDAEGKPLWSQTYGGEADDALLAVAVRADGTILATGVAGTALGSRGWLVVVDAKGRLLSSRRDLGELGTGFASLALDGEGVLLAGWQRKGASADGPQEGLGLKLDAEGTITWEIRPGIKGPLKVSALPIGGFVLAGSVQPSAGAPQAYFLRITGKRNVLWNETVGWGDAPTTVLGITPNGRGGVIGVGSVGPEGAGQAWAVHLDPLGQVIWEKSYGDGARAVLSDAVQLKDGGFMLIGTAEGGWSGGNDGLILRVDRDGEVIWAVTTSRLGHDGFLALAPLAGGDDAGSAMIAGFAFGIAGHDGLMVAASGANKPAQE